MVDTSLVAPDTFMLGSYLPGPEGALLPVNAFCLRGTEPTLVDTGLSPETDDFRAALWALIDPDDLRWIVLTHDDRDHTGSIRSILDEAPNATVVTNFISMAHLGSDWQLPLDRLRLVNAGDHLDIGDDVLETFRPPLFDSPGTLAFHALGRNVCFSSDSFGAFLPSLAPSAEDVASADYHAGMAVFASALSPWVHDVSAPTWQRRMEALRQRNIRMLLSTHGLPVSRSLGSLLDTAATVPTSEAFVPPAQEFVDAMLAMAGNH